LLIGLLLACGGSGDGQDIGQPDPQLQEKVAELIPRLANLAHLEVQRVPIARRSSEKRLESYLLERLEIEFPDDKLSRLTDAYRAFGLLPEDVDLRRLLVDLMLEQAVGYYDPVRDVFFVKDDAPEDLVDAVLVHELVHALQDQYVDLDSLMHSVEGNDARTAIQSAVEGQATLAMMAFQLQQMTGGEVTPTSLPDVDPDMMDVGAAASAYPELARAPAIIQKPLLFAYLGGARYVQRLWRQRKSHPPPFGRWLPASTEQLLHVEKILVERDRPVTLKIEEPGDGWRTVYSDNLGELETRIFFEEHLDDPGIAEQAAAGWDGDAYLLLERAGTRGLLWYTAWDSPEDAGEFVEAYRRSFITRFGGAGERESLSAPDRQARIEQITEAGVPLVRVMEMPVGVDTPEWPGVEIGVQ
jgi:hypothetical protein